MGGGGGSERECVRETNLGQMTEREREREREKETNLGQITHTHTHTHTQVDGQQKGHTIN